MASIPPEVRLRGSEVLVLHSEAVGDDYEISVFPPALPVDGPVPVVYCADADILVGMAANIATLLQGPGEVPPVRLVCIGYPPGDHWTDFTRLRTRDSTATRDPKREAAESMLAGGREIRGGCADAFLEFLTTELQPWVAANYDVTDDSTYVGYSSTGLFGIYTLFHRPTAFRRYVIGSPELDWNREVTMAYEAEYAAKHDDLDATVFLCAGADEDVLPPMLPDLAASMLRSADTAKLTRDLGENLASRGYPSLRLTTRVFPEETHFTIPALLIAHGLRTVFTAEREGAS